MIIFKLKNKIKQLAILAIIVSVILGITGRILAQSDSEKNSTDSKKTPAHSDNPSQQDRGLPSRGLPENLPNSDRLPTLQRGQAQSSNENPFDPEVVRATSRRSLGNIVKTLEDDERFQTLIEIIKLANLDSELEKPV